METYIVSEEDFVGSCQGRYEKFWHV